MTGLGGVGWVGLRTRQPPHGANQAGEAAAGGPVVVVWCQRRSKEAHLGGPLQLHAQPCHTTPCARQRAP